MVSLAGPAGVNQAVVETSACVGSLTSYEAWRVTSRVEPSANSAVTTSCSVQSPAQRSAPPGRRGASELVRRGPIVIDGTGGDPVAAGFGPRPSRRETAPPSWEPVRWA